MPDNESRPSLDHPWENGWAPDTSRAPGTRRLWLAGALAVATIVACVTAIGLNDQPADGTSAAGRGRTTSDKETSAGLISFASPSASGSPTPSAGSGSPSPSASASVSASPRPQGSSSPRTSAPASAPTASPTRGTSGSEPAAVRRSVQSVNYPDRYWHLSDGSVRLDVIGSGREQREDSTFTLVKGLAHSSCHSFRTSDGTYLRHRSFVLVKDRDDGSALFRQDATFCARATSSGVIALESVNYPGHFLRHERFQLKLQRYEHNGQYGADSAFRLVEGLA
ncbi:AbfB domain-containing protein [Streptomyces sp. NPDC051315]|uniref:AbfB domain-containing protein n=1 Tax=Streptomyces sp. NPDC051315 TaxID=3365650 RepID=UPI0037BE0E85